MFCPRTVFVQASLLFVLISGSLGAPADAPKEPPTRVISEVLPPSKDPWYKAPAGSYSSKHGEVLKVRNAPGNLTATLRNLHESVQIMYSTLNSLDEKTHAVTTVLVPKVPDAPVAQKRKRESPESQPTFPPRKQFQVVSYQIPYDSACVDSSPSYDLAMSSTELRLDVIDRMLERGWYVNIPDYETVEASFGAPIVAGRAVWDSIKAVRRLRSERFGISVMPNWGLWGYSGGGLATAWAWAIRADYAHEFERLVWAVAVGGVPTNLRNVMHRLDGTAASGLLINAISGLMKEYPQIQEQVTLAGHSHGPHNVSAFVDVRNMRFTESMINFAYHNMTDYFEGGLRRLMVPHIQRLFDTDFSLLQRYRVPSAGFTYRTRYYIYHGVQDEIVPIEDADKFARDWCYLGIPRIIEYDRILDGDHITVGDAAVDAVLERLGRGFEWKYARPFLAEEKMDEACYIRDVSMSPSMEDMDRYRPWIDKDFDNSNNTAKEQPDVNEEDKTPIETPVKGPGGITAWDVYENWVKKDKKKGDKNKQGQHNNTDKGKDENKDNGKDNDGKENKTEEDEKENGEKEGNNSEDNTNGDKDTAKDAEKDTANDTEKDTEKDAEKDTEKDAEKDAEKDDKTDGKMGGEKDGKMGGKKDGKKDKKENDSKKNNKHKDNAEDKKYRKDKAKNDGREEEDGAEDEYENAEQENRKGNEDDESVKQ